MDNSIKLEGVQAYRSNTRSDFPCPSASSKFNSFQYEYLCFNIIPGKALQYVAEGCIDKWTVHDCVDKCRFVCR